MIKIKEAIIVEGKYDKIKLSSLVDTLIIEVNGFRIFKDKEKAELIKILSKQRGIVILTDSDSAGNMIRNKIKSLVSDGTVYHAYVPQIKGKEKRKSTPSKEGTLGVEGMDADVILTALKKCGINPIISENEHDIITDYDLYSLGISGKSNSKIYREKLLKELNLPTNISKNNLLKIINYYIEKDELFKIINRIKEETANGGQS